MALFEDAEPSPRRSARGVPVTEGALAGARELLAGVRRKCPGGRTSLAGWARHLALAEAHYGAERYAKVFRWYVAHVLDDYVPVALCGKSFKEKFARIEHAMLASAKRRGDDLSLVDPGDEAREVEARLAFLSWPGACRGALGAAVQLSLDNYRAFFKQVRAAELTGAESKLAQRILDFVEPFASPPHFVERWLRDKAKWLVKLKDFKGRPSTLVLKTDSDAFQSLGRGVAARWAGDSKVWDRLVGKINA